MINKTISVIGLGYIGLPTAAMIAQAKVRVLGVDIAPQVIETVNQGKIHIIEPHLEEIVKQAVEDGYLRASLVPQPADIFLITVPTPFKDGYEPDLSCIKSAIKMVAPVLEKGNVVILESTSPVGTTEKIAAWLGELRPDLAFPNSVERSPDIHVAYCPERVLPGRVVEELVNNDRIIGGLTPKCALLAERVYRIFAKGELIHTDARTAEMAKLTENSFRDVNIAFANELSIICDKLKINVWELISLANHHPRVNILQPGPGVGGHCIAVDPWFIVSQTPAEAKLIRVARDVNDSKPAWVIDKVDQAILLVLREHPQKRLQDIKISCFGLTFKANIDDIRESPAMAITLTLARNYPNQVLAVEPNLAEPPSVLLEQNVKLWNINEALATADILLLLVDHREFKLIGELQRSAKQVIDTRGCWQQ